MTIQLLIASVALFSSSSSDAASKRESPTEMRRIIAQAICLAESYPNSPIANDSIAIVAAYQSALGGKATADKIAALRALVKKEDPSKPTPVGGHNFGIAHCVLFSDRPDVKFLLK
jgi:hypothetical protein